MNERGEKGGKVEGVAEERHGRVTNTLIGRRRAESIEFKTRALDESYNAENIGVAIGAS